MDELYKRVMIVIAFFLGIRKGDYFIMLMAAFTNRLDGSELFWSKITGFNVVRTTRYRYEFRIQLHNYIHDKKLAKEIGLQNSFIQQEFYSSGSYKLTDIIRFKKAQGLLQSEFNKLYKPQQ